MGQAIVIRAYGGAEVMEITPVDIGAPGPSEIRIAQTAIGVNYHDVYVRSGLYQTLALPGTPGCEAAGHVTALGEGVTGLMVGDRVAYVTSHYGAYASERLLPADMALRLPDTVTDQAAATNLLRAMTVEMLLSQVARIETGQTILVQAAAGGVGRLLCQWAAHRGLTVIGTVGSPEKAEIARAAGCTETILYREVDFVAEVARLTKGDGVAVAYDSVGADTFGGSLACLAPCGHLVNFGQSSGATPPVDMPQLATKSLTVSRPILFHYMATPDRYRTMAKAVFDAVAQGILALPPAQEIPLAEARRAHDILESRTGGGTLVLIP